jgi:hypothetical protein
MTVIEHELLRATVICDRNATSAAIELAVPLPGGDGDMLLLDATGSAKRESGDPFVPETGAAFALARALKSAAEQLEAAAWELVRDAERRAVDAAAKRELQKMVKALPKPGLKTSEIKEKYGEEAARLHRDRKQARKTQMFADAVAGTRDA